MHLNHKHIVLSARHLAAPLTTVEAVGAWLLLLVRKVGMTVLLGPYVTRCETPGNEGVTGIVCIETSHCTVHIWDHGVEPFLKADLYSCQDFDIATVIEHCRVFQPLYVDYLVVDRNNHAARSPQVLGTGVVWF